MRWLITIFLLLGSFVLMGQQDRIKPVFVFCDTLENMTIILDSANRCVAIDPEDHLLFEILLVDNGPDYPSEGLFRIVEQGKIGYANLKGEVVIQPAFPCAWPFQNGQAKVALDCREIREGEYTAWESDTWFFIDRNGKRLESQSDERDPFGLCEYYADTSHFSARYQNNQLSIFKDQTDLFAKIPLKGTPNSRCVEKQAGNYYMIAFSVPGDVTFQFLGLINRLDARWILQIEDPDLILDNPEFLGASINGDYFLFEGGTAPVHRSLQIVDRTGKILYEGSYLDADALVWNRNSVAFYKYAKGVPDYLPGLKDSHIWAQKVIWEKDGLLNTDQYRQIFVQ